MTLDLKAMKEAAERATPGRWEVYSEAVLDRHEAIAECAYQVDHTEPFVSMIYMINAGGKCPAITGCGETSEGNAAHIAASCPANVLALIALLEEAREALRPIAEIYVGVSMNDNAAASFPVLGDPVKAITAGDQRRARATLARIDAVMGAGGEG